MSKTLKCARNVILGALIASGSSALFMALVFGCLQATRYVCAILGWNYDGPLGGITLIFFVVSLIGAAFGAGKCWSERNA